MEKSDLLERIIYQQDTTALVLLSEQELKGPYPNWFYDQEVNQFNSHWAFPISYSSVESFVSSLTSNKTKIVFAIYELTHHVHIGNISIQAIDLLNRSAELAFLLGDKSAWGKGHGTRSARLCLDHCFESLGLNRVYLGCLSPNTAMNQLAIKLGFKQEGIRQQAALHKGSFVDVIEYGLLKFDYENHSSGRS